MRNIAYKFIDITPAFMTGVLLVAEAFSGGSVKIFARQYVQIS